MEKTPGREAAESIYLIQQPEPSLLPSRQGSHTMDLTHCAKDKAPSPPFTDASRLIPRETGLRKGWQLQQNYSASGSYSIKGLGLTLVWAAVLGRRYGGGRPEPLGDAERCWVRQCWGLFLGGWCLLAQYSGAVG